MMQTITQQQQQVTTRTRANGSSNRNNGYVETSLDDLSYASSSSDNSNPDSTDENENSNSASDFNHSSKGASNNCKLVHSNFNVSNHAKGNRSERCAFVFQFAACALIH